MMQTSSDHEELKALGYTPFDTHLLADSSVLDSIMSGKRTSDDAAFNLDDVQLSEATPKKVPPPNGKKTKGRVKIKMEFIDNKLRRYTTFSKRKTGIMKKRVFQSIDEESVRVLKEDGKFVVFSAAFQTHVCWSERAPPKLFLHQLVGESFRCLIGQNVERFRTSYHSHKTVVKAYELSTLTGTQVMLLVASETGHVYTFATRKLQPMITSEAGKALIQTCLNSPDPPVSGQAQATGPGAADQRMSATGFEETELTYSVTDDCENKDPKGLFGSLMGAEDDTDSEGSSHASPSPPPLAATAQGGSSGRTVPLPIVPAGTLVYQTAQGGLVYAHQPGSTASTDALVLNLGQSTAAHDTPAGSTAQQYITIPVAVTQQQQVFGGLTTWPGTTAASTSQKTSGSRGQSDKP